MRFRADISLLCGAAALLSSCGMSEGDRQARPGSQGAGRQAVADFPVKIGKPYQAGGITYVPADIRDYDTLGYATWYGEEHRGSRTANGEAFDPEAVSAAHRTLPMPCYVEVTALDTGRTILVRVNDRGPFVNGRLIDLSKGAARQLGISGSGMAAVRVRRVEPPERDRATLRSGRSAAQRPTLPESLLTQLRAKLGVQSSAFQSEPLPDMPNGASYAIQVAAFSAVERARVLARGIGADVVSGGANVWRVRFGPYADAASALSGLKMAASKGYPDARILINDAP